MPDPCKVCTAPTIIRDFIERMRTAGISYRDCALVAKVTREYDISHAAIQRHEVNSHFNPGAVLGSVVGEVDPSKLNMKTIVTHKLAQWWAANKDLIPNTREVQDWMRIAAQFAEADRAVAEAEQIRAAFRKPDEVRVLEAELGTSSDSNL